MDAHGLRYGAREGICRIIYRAHEMHIETRAHDRSRFFCMPLRGLRAKQLQVRMACVSLININNDL